MSIELALRIRECQNAGLPIRVRAMALGRWSTWTAIRLTSATWGADRTAIAMRQLTPITNLMLACLCAMGLLGALELPWFALVDPASGPSAQAIKDGQGPMESFAGQVVRTFSSDGIASSGSDVLGDQRTLLMIVAAIVVVLSVAMLVPALRAALRDVLRAVGLAAPLLVLFIAIQAPGADGLEFRWGLVCTVAIALFMASAAWHGSSARSPRAVAATRTRRVA